MKTKKLVVFPLKITNELFQSLDIKFSLLQRKDEDTFEQCHTAIKCRDFLGDCLWSRATNKEADIYGFKYNFNSAPFYQELLALSLKFPDEHSKENFITNFSKLNEIEQQAGVTESVWYETSEDNTIIVVSDKAWHSNVWKLSLFTFFMKVISYKDEHSLRNPEDKYITHLTPEIRTKLLSKVATEFTEHVPESIYEAHNTSGFISVIKNQNEVMNKLLLSKENI